MINNLKALLCALLLSPVLVFADEPTLSIATKSEKKTFTLSELMKRNDIETITVKNDPAYPGQEMTYKAIKVTSLFGKMKVDDDSVIQFKALDGFSAPISKNRLLSKSSKESIGYVAMEPTNQKWPPLNSGKPSAGPFYLIWKDPELSHISPEEWPFMLAAFEVKGSLEDVYPKIFPSSKLGKNNSVSKGFRLFVKNCFACHTMNKSGASMVGPDLNVPMNPTEYFKESSLRKLIRNPQNIRHWPNSRMNGFEASVISNKDLNHLIAYLKHMAKRKK